MLPGIRFLFAAVVLAMSVLVFGVGAAAWLRAAHEQFASLPSRLTPAEPVLARQIDAPVPTLALLRFDPPTTEKLPEAEKIPEDAPPAATPETVTPAVEAPDAAPVEPEQTAALTSEEPAPVEAAPEEPAPVEAAKQEIPAADIAEATPPAPAEAVAPVADEEAPVAEETPVANEQAKVAAIAEPPAPPPATAPVAPQSTTDILSLEGNVAATKIATLGGPAVVIDEAADAKPDRRAVRKRAAHRARERRRRIAARRAWLARQAAALAAQQQRVNPFGQPPIVRRTQ